MNEKKGSIILNDDFAHFISSRFRNAIKVNEKVINEYIDQYIGTQVTHFLLNVNASLSYSPSKVIETAYDRFLLKEIDGIPVDYTNTDLEIAYDIYINKGLDYHGIMIDRLRKNNIQPWISIRINDLHGFKDNLDSRTSNFRAYAVKNNLCRTTHRPQKDYFDRCFDFAHDEIKDRMLAYIDEQLNNYDVDGIELDFLREAFMFKLGEEEKGRLVINDMLVHVNNTIEKLAKERGHEIKILIRVPSNPIHAYDMGFDIYTWAKKELVDILVATPRFHTCDSTMPLESLSRMFENDKMEIVGGIELFTNPVAEKINLTFGNTPEILNGFAIQYLSSGTDKIYLYNYFDDPGLKGDSSIDTMSFTNDDIVCENDRDACAQAQCYYQDILSTVGSLSTCKDLSRRHILTFNDISPHWVDIKAKLPFKVNTSKNEYAAIKTGKINLKSYVTLLLGIKDIDNSNDLTIWCNNELCKYIRETKIFPKMSKYNVYVFEINNKYLKDFKQVIEIETKKNAITVDYVEIRVNAN